MINPAVKEKQIQQDTHWQNNMTGNGTIKAEESGKIVVLTDIVGYATASALSVKVRAKDASGAVLLQLYNPQNTMLVISFREGLEAAAYDGSNAGDLYCHATTIGYCFFSGYMRDA